MENENNGMYTDRAALWRLRGQYRSEQYALLSRGSDNSAMLNAVHLSR